MNIYTRTGDQGQTSLVGGQRVSKSCARLESYGTIDELCSQIGLLITYCTAPHDSEFLTNIQNTLFVVGGYLATDNSQREVRTGNIVTPDMVTDLEQEIDRINATLPPFRCFILPGGCRAAALAHVCRTVCRRAERRILALCEEGAQVDAQVIAYVNRLSDYLFVLARKLNADEKHPEIIWQRTK
ncbi:MAG: cob(I)yrinic acid a,c-diamide adenosyltransferase [Bacteroidaceae bacterium]|nr:cob(I)yrinic acid a,c-diamide adenosyltransferase [Bacteroidaceae bacterium]